MDNIKMYDDAALGDGKFGLKSGGDRNLYRLLVRSVEFRDAGAFFCQSANGEKAKAALTVRNWDLCGSWGQQFKLLLS